VVSHFVRAYAQRLDRRALLDNPEHMREIESTIGREALLSMAAEARRLMPRAFAGSRRAQTPEEAALSHAFLAEFLASLNRAALAFLGGGSGELALFQRDLEMYGHWHDRRSSGSGTTVNRQPTATSLESPFPDRCALLLDPAMMQDARRAAVEFESQLTVLAARIFDRLGRHGLSAVHRRPKSRPPRRAARSARKFAPRAKSLPARKRPRRAPKRGPGCKSRPRRKSHPQRKR
jgi:hypothetical protein